MESFFNDSKNRDVIKIIGSFLDFVSLGNFLKSSKVINHSCKPSLPDRELDSDEISKALKASYKYRNRVIKFYDTRVINTSCFYRLIEVIIYGDDIYRKSDGYHIDTEFCNFERPMKVGDYHDDYHFSMSEHYFVIGDKKQGCHKTYWENGSLQGVCFYKDDKINGILKSYWENGSFAGEHFYKNGEKDGTIKKKMLNATV